MNECRTVWENLLAVPNCTEDYHYSGFPSISGEIFRLLLKISVVGNSWWVYKSYFWKPSCMTGRHVKWIETCNRPRCSKIHEHDATVSIVLSVPLRSMYSTHESNKYWRCNNEVTFVSFQNGSVLNLMDFSERRLISYVHLIFWLLCVIIWKSKWIMLVT